MPKPISEPKDIENLVIVKRQGAAGGKGYFMAANEEDYHAKRNQLISEGVLSKMKLYTFRNMQQAFWHTCSSFTHR